MGYKFAMTVFVCYLLTQYLMNSITCSEGILKVWSVCLQEIWPDHNSMLNNEPDHNMKL